MTTKPEFTGSILTSTDPMTPAERLATWIMKRPGPMFWRAWKKPAQRVVVPLRAQA